MPPTVNAQLMMELGKKLLQKYPLERFQIWSGMVLLIVELGGLHRPTLDLIVRFWHRKF